jgi:uncharacterized membrane-anchored protein
MVKLSRTILVFFTLAGFATTLGAAAADFAAGFAIAFFAGTVFAGAALGAQQRALRVRKSVLLLWWALTLQ